MYSLIRVVEHIFNINIWIPVLFFRFFEFKNKFRLFPATFYKYFGKKSFFHCINVSNSVFVSILNNTDIFLLEEGSELQDGHLFRLGNNCGVYDQLDKIGLIQIF
ncbi:hypothetical protein BpHYR1_026830 [Brachionus plicatilis]|uniref:Uncharacterized protein n=1 Tax=Brachionus plicatilis TaxID=10195 RepID=A0A3M7QBS6_BRAPC|nr:hypothetical protein BpHYR1_026830 [Brachionus plicatilis]